MLENQLVTFVYNGVDATFQASTDAEGCISDIQRNTKYPMTISVLGEAVITNGSLSEERLTYEFES